MTGRDPQTISRAILFPGGGSTEKIITNNPQTNETNK